MVSMKPCMKDNSLRIRVTRSELATLIGLGRIERRFNLAPMSTSEGCGSVTNASRNLTPSILFNKMGVCERLSSAVRRQSKSSM